LCRRQSPTTDYAFIIGEKVGYCKGFYKKRVKGGEIIKSFVKRNPAGGNQQGERIKPVKRNFICFDFITIVDKCQDLGGVIMSKDNSKKTAFAERLKQAMQAANLNQIDLAGASGASRAAISQYLSGKNIPTESRIKRLAEVTGVSVKFLLGNDFGCSSEKDLPQKKFEDIKITFVQACRCLRKSEDTVRAMMIEGCDFGKAVQGTGRRLNYVFYPAKFRDCVGAERFNEFFGVTN